MFGIKKTLRLAAALPGYVASQPKPMVVVFLHVPKCAGTTANDAFRANYNPWRILEPPNWTTRSRAGGLLCFAKPELPEVADLLRRLEKVQHRIDCVLGHLPFGIHRHIERPCRYLTFIRDPVARVWSSYNHTMNDPSHFLYPVLERHKFDLAAALDAGELPEFANHQSRMLLGEPALCYSMADADRLVQHVQSQFHFIGTMERFEDGMNTLKTELRWPRMELHRLNVGAYERVQRQPDKRQVAAIKWHNQLDQLLYDLVCQKQRKQTPPEAIRSAA